MNLRQGEKVLALLQEEYPSYHPLIGVAKIAHETEDERLQFDCHKTLCRYVEPELKSVEVVQHLPDDAHLRVIFEGDFEELPKPNDGTAALEKLPVDELLESSALDSSALEHPGVTITAASDEHPDAAKPALTLVPGDD